MSMISDIKLWFRLLNKYFRSLLQSRAINIIIKFETSCVVPHIHQQVKIQHSQAYSFIHILHFNMAPIYLNLAGTSMKRSFIRKLAGRAFLLTGGYTRSLAYVLSV